MILKIHIYIKKKNVILICLKNTVFLEIGLEEFI